MSNTKIYKMKELLNTRFLYVTFCLDINHIMSCCETLAQDPTAVVNAGNEVQLELFNDVRRGITPIFDLCDCKITSDVTQLVYVRQDEGVLFIDSKDAYRDSILKENTRRKRELPEQIIPMPIYDMKKPISQYIQELSTDVVYTYPDSNEPYPSLIVMTTLLRPAVQFAMDNVMADVFKIVSDLIPYGVLEKFDEFYFYSKEGVEILKVKDGKVRTQRLGTIPIERASAAGYLVPTIFGKERLYKTDGWDIVFNKALATVNRMREARPRTLREVLTGE